MYCIFLLVVIVKF